MSFSRFRADHAQNRILPAHGKLDASFFDYRRVFAFVAKQGVDHIARAFRGAPAQRVQQDSAGNRGDANTVRINRVGFHAQHTVHHGHAGIQLGAPHQGQPQGGGGDWFQHRVILLLCRNMAKAFAFVMRNGSAMGAR